MTVSASPHKKNNYFFLSVAGLPPPGPAQVLVALVEDGLVSKVLRGENEGQTLPHTAVVRALKSIGSIAAGDAAWEGEFELPSDAAWKRPRAPCNVGGCGGCASSS